MSKDQRFCTHCGRRMVPFYPAAYPESEWLHCPREGSFWQFLDGGRHDIAIIGRRNPNGPYDPVSGRLASE